MIIIFVEFIHQLIDYPINCASLNPQYVFFEAIRNIVPELSPNTPPLNMSSD